MNAAAADLEPVIVGDGICSILRARSRSIAPAAGGRVRGRSA
jgi:hypothetical protein